MKLSDQELELLKNKIVDVKDTSIYMVPVYSITIEDSSNPICVAKIKDGGVESYDCYIRSINNKTKIEPSKAIWDMAVELINNEKLEKDKVAELALRKAIGSI